MKPSEFYEKYVILQDHQGKWHKPSPPTELMKKLMDSPHPIIIRKGLHGKVKFAYSKPNKPIDYDNEK